MANLRSVIDFFNKKREQKALRGEDDRENFIRRYQAFREVLKYNNEVLLLMADMQEKATGVFVFDKAYVQSSYQAVSISTSFVTVSINSLDFLIAK